MSTEVLPHTIEPHPVTGMYNGKFGMWLFLASEIMLFGALFSSYVLLRVHGNFPAHGESGLNVPIGTLNTMILITSSVTMVFAWAALKMNEPGKARKYLAATAILALAFLAIKLAFEYRPKLTHYTVWVAGRDAPLDGHIHADDAEQNFIEFVPDDHVQAHAAGDEHVAGEDQAAGDDQAGHDDHGVMRIPRADIEWLVNYGPSRSTFYATYYTMTGLHAVHIIGGVLVIGYFLLPGFGMYRRNPVQFTNRIECTGLYWHFVDLVWIFLFPLFYLL